MLLPFLLCGPGVIFSTKCTKHEHYQKKRILIPSKVKQITKSKITPEVGNWVGPGLTKIFFGKSSKNSPMGDYKYR